MGPRALLLVLSLVLAAPLAPEAQQAGPALIGLLRLSPPPRPLIDAFKTEMRALGYVEGGNVIYIEQWGDGDNARLPELVALLLQRKVQLIVTDGTAPSLAARAATSTVPIVMAATADPVGAGLVQSLALPGGNVTGVSNQGADRSGKLLELIREAMPRVQKVAIMFPRSSRSRHLFEARLKQVAPRLGLDLMYVEVSADLGDIDRAVKDASKAQAMVVPLTPGTTSAQRRQIAELALAHRVPTFFLARDFVDQGGLLSYSSDNADNYRRVAFYIDKILKGAKPADLPVEQATKFELVINLKTAKALGLTIPPALLLRADHVIE